MYELTICAETVYPDLSFAERVQKITEAGFKVEFWDWRDKSGDDLEKVTGITRGFSGSRLGSMMHPDGVDEWLRDLEESIEVAERIGCRNLFIATGAFGPNYEAAHPIAESPIVRWITAYKTLHRGAEIAEEHGVVLNLEPLNTLVDHPGYPLPFAHDAADLVREVDSPHMKVLLDVYHVQIMQGHLSEQIRDARDVIGHVHIADVPGRGEPGTGEINYEAIARELKRGDFEGCVGLECYPKGDSGRAMEAFRTTFS